MAKKRRARPPRLALVELGQLRDLSEQVAQLETAVSNLIRVVGELQMDRINRASAAQRAAETRRQRQAAQAQAAQPDQAAAEPTPTNGAQP